MKLTPKNFRRWVMRQIEADYRVTTELVHRPNVCVEIEVDWDSGNPVPFRYTGVGFAKVCYPDRWDESEGVAIATAKAISHVSKQVIADLEKYSALKAALEGEFLEEVGDAPEV